MGKYGPGIPGTHQTGPIVSEYGFRVGDKKASTEVITQDGLIEPKLFWESLMDSGVAYAKDYAKTATGNDTLVANPTNDAECLVIVTVTEAFADVGDDDQTIFKIGKIAHEDDLDDAIMGVDVLVDAPVGYQYVWSGTISATAEIVNVHAVPAEATNGGGTGAINVLVIFKEEEAE